MKVIVCGDTLLNVAEGTEILARNESGMVSTDAQVAEAATALATLAEGAVKAFTIEQEPWRADYTRQHHWGAGIKVVFEGGRVERAAFLVATPMVGWQLRQAVEEKLRDRAESVRGKDEET